LDCLIDRRYKHGTRASLYRGARNLDGTKSVSVRLEHHIKMPAIG
jgi:hypothetical protein